jgi:hypothetical protein
VKDQARNTVEDQLSEICDSLSFDFIMVSGARGEPLAAVIRETGGFAPLSLIRLHTPEQGFFSVDDRLYEVTSVPIHEAGAQVATLTVGGRFDISRFGVPAVLLHQGAVIEAQMRDLAPAQIEKALATCASAADCELRIQDETYLSLPCGSWRRQLYLAQSPKCGRGQRAAAGRVAEIVSDNRAYRDCRHAGDQRTFFAIDRSTAGGRGGSFASQRGYRRTA